MGIDGTGSAFELAEGAFQEVDRPVPLGGISLGHLGSMLGLLPALAFLCQGSLELIELTGVLGGS